MIIEGFRRFGVLIVGAFMAALTPSAQAAPSKVYSPRVEFGEFEIEHRGIVEHDDDPSKDGKVKLKTGFGYGLTERVFVELYGEHEREPGGSLKFEGLEFEALIQLTPTGRYWADFGFLAEYKFSGRRGGSDEIEFGPLVEKQIGRTVHTANLIIAKEISPDAESFGLEYAWASRLRLSQAFEPGFEAYGEVGEITHIPGLKNQEHMIGPAVSGRLPLGGGGAVKYQAAYLFGLTDETPQGAFRWLLEYEMRF